MLTIKDLIKKYSLEKSFCNDFINRQTVPKNCIVELHRSHIRLVDHQKISHGRINKFQPSQLLNVVVAIDTFTKFDFDEKYIIEWILKDIAINPDDDFITVKIINNKISTHTTKLIVKF